jgi:small subunit ribosomal protein S18
MAERRKRRETKVKICRLCESKINYIDFKDVELLKKYQTEKGRILPRRITGTCLDHQKMLSTAIKRARVLSLVL